MLIQGQPQLQSEFEPSQGYVRHYPPPKKKKGGKGRIGQRNHSYGEGGDEMGQADTGGWGHMPDVRG